MYLPLLLKYLLFPAARNAQTLLYCFCVAPCNETSESLTTKQKSVLKIIV